MSESILPLIKEWNIAKTFLSHYDHILSVVSYVFLSIIVISEAVGLWQLISLLFTRPPGAYSSLERGLLSDQEMDTVSMPEQDTEFPDTTGRLRFRLYLSGGAPKSRLKLNSDWLALGMPDYDIAPEGIKTYLSESEYNVFKKSINRRLYPLVVIIVSIMVYASTYAIRMDTLSFPVQMLVRLIQIEPTMIFVVWMVKSVQYELVSLYCDNISENNIVLRNIGMKWTFLWSLQPGLAVSGHKNFIVVTVDGNARGKDLEKEAVGMYQSENLEMETKEQEKKHIQTCDVQFPVSTKEFDECPVIAVRAGLRLRTWKVILTSLDGVWRKYHDLAHWKWKEETDAVIETLNDHFKEEGSPIRIHFGFMKRRKVSRQWCRKAARKRYTYQFPCIRVSIGADTMADVMNVDPDYDDSGFWPLLEVDKVSATKSQHSNETNGRGLFKHVSVITLFPLLLRLLLWAPLAKRSPPTTSRRVLYARFTLTWLVCVLSWASIGVCVGDMDLTWFHGLLLTTPALSIAVFSVSATWGIPRYDVSLFPPPVPPIMSLKVLIQVCGYLLLLAIILAISIITSYLHLLTATLLGAMIIIPILMTCLTAVTANALLSNVIIVGLEKMKEELRK